MNFTLEATGETSATPVLVNPGHRGLQMLVSGSLGDDDHRATVAILMISGTNDEVAAEVVRFEGIAPGTTTGLMFYPGINENAGSEFSSANCVLPAKYVVTLHGDTGTSMVLDGTTLP